MIAKFAIELVPCDAGVVGSNNFITGRLIHSGFRVDFKYNVQARFNYKYSTIKVVLDSTVVTNKVLVQKRKGNEHEQPFEVVFCPSQTLLVILQFHVLAYLFVFCLQKFMNHFLFTYHFLLLLTYQIRAVFSLTVRELLLYLFPSSNTSDYAFISDEKYLSVG